ncbi:MAG TPA: formimidoylglutamate deiminase [Ktedonobacteraceae bacterium]
MKYLAPDYVYTPAGLQAEMVVAISDNGLISGIEPRAADQLITDPLPGIALLPGFVNAHSHVFQRALRGHTQRPISERDTFWTWRRAMYAEAARLDPDRLYAGALRTYREMLAAGYTTVGEFHYVHHQPDGQPYARPNAMSEAILQAGREAGLRVVLLMTAYAQNGFDQPPEESQLRFCDATVEAYLERVEALLTAGVLVGLAPHSVRAVPASWFHAIVEYSRVHQLPLHIHAGEQRAEVEQTQAAYGCTPIELLERFGALDGHTTIIHATHVSAREIELLANAGSTVCVCPTTEGDLGDGIAPYAELLAAGIPLAIGADSNTRLDPCEELRWAEYSARMRYQRRRILVADAMASPGSLLLTMGTTAGARALGLASGEIAVGQSADLVAINLNHPTLAGWTAEDWLDGLFFGASSEVIVGTWVQGHKANL